MDLTGKKVALIIASQGFQPLEYGIPKKLLETEGIEVVTISDKPGGAIASDKTTAIVDETIQNMRPQDFDGIFFIGGPGAMDCLDNSISYKIIAQAKKLQIPYGAICISPRILAKAYGLQGMKATCWDEDSCTQAIFHGFGATFVPHEVVTDGLIVTANGPGAAAKFADGILRVLTKKALE